MIKKEDTPERTWRRKYELEHKEEREQATVQFNTRLPREKSKEICDFLDKYGIRKIDLIYAGYIALKEQIESEKSDK